ncbi:MAG: hypothetical protein BWK79_06370 [Beggiatoa sp. IS2]|nr:MAG: hypothetical protein BWK79_06370 [Beggiatoa sp. IS2]
MDSNELFLPFLSTLDEERFGIRTARVKQVTSATLPSVLDFCRYHQVQFLIARCPVNDIAAAQAMEREDFLLMDTLLYYVRDLVKLPIPADTGKTQVRPLRQGEEDAVQQVAAGAFQGYFGHYHADNRLERQKCDEAYVSWAMRSCVSREVADEILVAEAEMEGKIVGFATLKRHNVEEGEGLLYGVAPEAQKQGIHSSLAVHSMRWGVTQGIKRFFYSTQINNIAVQKVWVRVGAELSHAYYTFHKWFN